MNRPIQNTTRETVKRCAWCDRLCFNETEIFCSAECRADAILGDHELAPEPDCAQMAKVAAAWWRKAVERPKFDAMGRQDDESFAARDDILLARSGRRSMEIASMMAMLAVPQTDGSAFAAFEAALFTAICAGTPRHLSVDYHPDGILADAAVIAILPELRFPWKTHMWLDWEAGAVKVSHGYGAPIEVIFGGESDPEATP